MKVNINSFVSFRLTHAGAEVLLNWYRQLFGFKAESRMPPGWNTGRTMKIQIWAWMEIFGPATSMTGPTLFVENELEFKEA